MSENGNGNQKPLEIDVTDEHAFRTGVVQHLQFIADRTADLPSLRKKVDRHENIVKVGTYATVPLFAGLHLAVKHFMTRMGW